MRLFIPLLTVLFIGLKLTGYVAWSWLWVLSPMWVTALVVIVLTVLVAYFEIKHQETIMAYKQIKLIDYVTDATLTAEQNARARKCHYESEILRIQAAEIIQVAKDSGKTIMVQGQQND